MGKRFTQFLVLGVCLLLAAGFASAQMSTTGRLIGTVTDPSGAVVVGADVKAVDEATGKTYESKSGNDGGFTFPALQPGSYTITVTMQGFKKTELRALKVVVGGQHGLTVKLELGEVASTVVIEAGAEVLQTSETKVGTTITGKTLTQLPFSSRDAMDLALLMPGASTVGRPRATSFNGLPKGAINITMDGINAQDQELKSSDGFFTLIRPRVDTIDEFSITTAAAGAGEAGEGAVQVRFETKRGTNEYHGGAWWYHRNDKFSSNYYFNNEVQPGAKSTVKQKQRLNQQGVKVGGPIFKDKLFFFTAVDLYRNPAAQSRTRTVLTPEAYTGVFRYALASAVTRTAAAPLQAWMNCGAAFPAGFVGTIPANTQCTANLMSWAAGLPAATLAHASLDPFVFNNYLNILMNIFSVPGVSEVATTSLFQRNLSFNNQTAGRRNFPDFRFDYNLNKNHSITAIYHYNYFTSTPDTLNGRDYTYPIAPFNTSLGSQISNRNELVSAWRWNIGTTKTNEVRVGLVSAPVSFFPDLNLSLYPTFSTNVGNYLVRPALNLVSNPLQGCCGSGRNGGIMQVIDTFSWTRGKHNFTFGGNWTEVIYKDYADNGHVAGISMGIGSDDPMRSPTEQFSSTNFPGSSSTDQGNMRSLYAMLTGRVSGFSTNANLNDATRTFGPNLVSRNRFGQTEIAIYGTDNYRLFSTLTLNVGVRWDWQGPFREKKNKYYNVSGDFDGLAGYSCNLNGLFKPTATGCATTTFNLNGTRAWWQNDLNNFAPSIGLAWTPSFGGSIAKWIFGGPSKSVFRAGYSISYTREGIANFESISGSNPGLSSSVFSSETAGGTQPGQFAPGTVFLNSQTIPNVAVVPATFGSPIAATSNANLSFGGNAFDSHLGIPYVQSWQIGWQREITPSTVIEVRYVGTHGTGLWRQFNLNETNIFQPNSTINGVAVPSYLTEFKNAQSNLAICRTLGATCLAAQAAAGVTAANQTVENFANWGLAGQVPLPIFTTAFTGATATPLSAATIAPGSLQQRNSGFRSTTWTTSEGFLDLGLAGSGAGNLNSLSVWTALVNGGFPRNWWLYNPDLRGGVFPFGNSSHSTYNALQIEFRRKPLKGLQFNGSYTFAKSLTDINSDDSANFAGYSSIREKGRDKGPSPFEIRHAFKLQLIYEMPFGPGRRWSSSMAWLNRVIEGWEINTITRWQSGRLTQITGGRGGTFNGSDGGVQLIGITPKQLQDMLGIRKTADGQVFYFPESLLNRLTSTTARANESVLKPCSTAGAFCQRLFVTGPAFFRPDWSIGKRTKISEKVNIEYRAEFLNAFNNINFFYGGASTGISGTDSLRSTSFGRVTEAYRDISTTDDLGGRIIQMVLRINF